MSSVDLNLRGDDITWDNGVMEKNLDYEIVYFFKFPC
jgi:hypothetical protein